MKQRENAKAQLVEELSDVAIRFAEVGRWSFDIESQELFWCEQTHKIFGTQANDGLSLNEAIKFYHPADLEKFEVPSMLV
ncbi:MAG: hypothetical protein HLUCCO02_04175 [Idiomarinaceae bacterium HL-53]|nr:MAG: hypothetical protein HLUCCO02_04175 [Idiomarinaceae bacterium HL-53]CUS49212.1 hypothetical protein Ga0003345_2200 [Idiomarinaceae bacterium HL-53]